MKQHVKIVASFLLLFSAACNNPDAEVKQSENDIDAARNFIRAALDGKFKEARTFLFTDSVNNQYLDAAERNYQKLDPDTKRSYREASINIHNVSPVNDSTTVVIYSNSYKNDHDTLRVVRKNAQWLVDLKYLFQHDTDTSQQFTLQKDTLK
ncbi:MAG TPA: hypothetical protein VFS36_01575 [Chitinophagaceae bacterium]|jgi:hypothetical protein|nr:hypothetical protein [Chitinophagaceae bacterium]